MDILVVRYPSCDDRTLSEVFIDGEFFCYGLEDVIRESETCTARNIKEWKVYGKTAIPQGKYRVTMTWSPRFKRAMCLINEVPGFIGILIHNGKGPESTEGCLIVNFKKEMNYEREAMLEIEKRVMAAIDAKQAVTITFVNLED